MHILIIKDGATKIPREVADLAEARGIQAQGFSVLVVVDDGEVPLEKIADSVEEASAPAAPKAKGKAKG
jgi:hypothetical protein